MKNLGRGHRIGGKTLKTGIGTTKAKSRRTSTGRLKKIVDYYNGKGKADYSVH